jgi:hypothetical protein
VQYTAQTFYRVACVLFVVYVVVVVVVIVVVSMPPLVVLDDCVPSSAGPPAPAPAVTAAAAPTFPQAAVSAVTAAAAPIAPAVAAAATPIAPAVPAAPTVSPADPDDVAQLLRRWEVITGHKRARNRLQQKRRLSSSESDAESEFWDAEAGRWVTYTRAGRTIPSEPLSLSAASSSSSASASSSSASASSSSSASAEPSSLQASVPGPADAFTSSQQASVPEPSIPSAVPKPSIPSAEAGTTSSPKVLPKMVSAVPAGRPVNAAAVTAPHLRPPLRPLPAVHPADNAQPQPNAAAVAAPHAVDDDLSSPRIPPNVRGGPKYAIVPTAAELALRPYKALSRRDEQQLRMVANSLRRDGVEENEISSMVDMRRELLLQKKKMTLAERRSFNHLYNEDGEMDD